jgi:hypothetical protein
MCKVTLQIGTDTVISCLLVGWSDAPGAVIDESGTACDLIQSLLYRLFQLLILLVLTEQVTLMPVRPQNHLSSASLFFLLLFVL